METAIDKPVLFEYMPLGNENSYSQNADHDTSPILLAMAAGAASVRSMTTSGAPDLIVSEADYAPVEIYLIDAVAFSGWGRVEMRYAKTWITRDPTFTVSPNMIPLAQLDVRGSLSLGVA